MKLRKYLLLNLFIFCFLSSKSQNLLSLSVGRSMGSYQDLNHAIQTFNAARPWLEKQLPLMQAGIYADFTPSVRLSDKWKLSIPLSYRRMSAFAANDNFETFALIQHFQAHLMMEFYPGLAPDTLDPMTPKFLFAFGPGGSLILPKVYFNNQPAQVNEGDYQSLNYHFSARIMAGLTIPLGERIDITPFFQADIIPNMQIRDFDVALHGKSLEKTAQSPAFVYAAGLRLQFRMFPRSPEEDNLSAPAY